MNSKSFLASKTVWAGIVVPLVIGLIPGASDWVKNNPGYFTDVIGVLIIVLRWVTKGGISLSAPDFGVQDKNQQ